MGDNKILYLLLVYKANEIIGIFNLSKTNGSTVI